MMWLEMMMKKKPIQSYAKIYAKGVVSAVATDHHDKDGQCLNQQLQLTMHHEDLSGIGDDDDDAFESLGFYRVFDCTA